MSSDDSDFESGSNSGSPRKNFGQKESQGKKESESDTDESLSDDDDDRAVQIIKIQRTSDNDENLHLTLNSQQFNKILETCGDRHLCIICCVGAVRTGKSFLLNSIKERLQSAQDGTPSKRNVTYTGFPFKSGYAAVTKGIWMWNKAFILEGKDEEVAVLLMDTEGINDELSKPDEIAAILGLSLLSSSTLILNFMGDLTCSPFNWLTPFTKDARKQQQFQRLSILVHDWTRLSSNRYGDKSGRKLLDKFLNQNSGKCGKLANAFEELDCFLLPHIGEKALQQKFSGRSSDLSKEFSKYLQKYTNDITDGNKLPVKKVLDTEITAKEFKYFFVEYVNFFNNPTEMELGPRPEAISALIRETAGKIKISRGLDEYHKTLRKKRRTSVGTANYMRDQDLELLHTQAIRKGLQAFKTFSLPTQDEKEFEKKFDQEISKLIGDSRAANENERKEKIKENIDKAYERLKDELEENFPFKSEAGTNIPDNLVFYDNDHLDSVIEGTRQSVDDNFFGEFAGDDDEELEDLRRKLDTTLEPLIAEFRNKNIENRERANEKGEEAVKKFLSDYLNAMQKKIKRLPKLDEATLLVFHETEMEKVDTKFDNMKLGTPDFKQQWKDDLTERIDEELETMKLNLESTMAEALKLINEYAKNYQTNLQEEADDMEEDEILAYHEDKSKSIIQKFVTVNPYPPENPKYDDVESRLKRKLKETYEKVVEDGILIRRKEEEKLESILESSCDTLEKDLEDAIQHADFLFEEESASTLKNTQERAKSKYEEKLLQVGADRQKVEEERTKFQSKTKKIMEKWARENEMKRDSAIAEAEKILQKCTENYETKMGASVTTLNTKNELLSEHENAKEGAIKEFQDQCLSNNSFLVANYIQKLESRVNEMSEEIEEHFDMLQKSYDVGLRAALFDAKNYYQENMDKMFDANKQGFFKEEELQKKNNELYKGAIKAVADHKLNTQQKQKLEQQLKDLFTKYKQKNATIQTSYDSKNVAIGIDLGTTYCCVAAYHMGKVTIIRNTRGNNITPSYVTIKPDGSQVVGDTAKEEAYKNPEYTIFDAKRMIGRRLDDEKLQSDMKYWPFTVEEKDSKAQIKAHGMYYLPEQISAMILKHLKKEAEEILRVEVTKAVITVPAYFTDGQRQATIDAGELAGLEVLGILNEPTAAAVAYRLEWHSVGRSRNILVYDLGGGTFDVAILKISDSKMDVLTVNGDSHLGGEDFDKNMMQYCAEEFKKEAAVDLLLGKDSKVKVESDEAKRRMRRLQGYCENAKKALATAPTTAITVDEMVRGHDLSVDVSRKKFEELNATLFAKTIRIVDEALKSAGLEKDEIDDVVLVGGSTRIRKLQEMLEKHFNGKALNKSINPDEAVAYGAAVQAAILNANPGSKLFDFGVIQEVTPMSLGIEVVSGEMDVIIAKNTKIPTSQKQEYRTHKDGQTSCSIRIFQGEETLVRDNKLLGNFVLNGIPRGPAGREIVDVTMNINTNGILSVEAMCRSTKGKQSITVSEDKGRLTKEEKRRILKESS